MPFLGFQEALGMVTFHYTRYEAEGTVCFSSGHRTRGEHLKKIQCQDRKPEHKFGVQTQYVLEHIKSGLQKSCGLSIWP